MFGKFKVKKNKLIIEKADPFSGKINQKYNIFMLESPSNLK